MKKLLKRKNELLLLLSEVKCADSEYDYKLQTINEIEYQLYVLEANIHHYKMIKPLKYMLYGFVIASIVLITYAIFV
jgi:hypothetical protein